jgi:hypothetical protein
MDPFFVMTDQYSQGKLHDLPFSARPNAPVRPYKESRRRLRRLRRT